MSRTCCTLLIVLQMLLVGCGDSSDSGIVIGKPSKIPTPTPLTVDEWKELPNNTEKYDPSTLERIRASDPALESNKAWDELMKQVVIPEIKKNKEQNKPI